MVIAGNPNDAHGVARVTMGKISEVTNWSQTAFQIGSMLSKLLIWLVTRAGLEPTTL